MPRLTILNVAFPFAKVAEHTAGGAEQIVFALDRHLCEAGHRSLVLAQAGSKVTGELVPVPIPELQLDGAAQSAVRRSYQQRLFGVLRRERIDVVHLHGLDFHGYLPPESVPSLATLHLPTDWYPQEAFRRRPNLWRNCVSQSQYERCGPREAVEFVVNNGVDVARFQPRSDAARGYVLALGRICPEKGFHEAFDAARAADLPLVLAGELFQYAEHERYWQEKIRPRLTATRSFIGPVAFEQKRALLADARCVVIPSLVAETSSLVAMEALASGTPVVARPAGALPELIEQGVTGFLVEDVEQMATALQNSIELDSKACRAAAERRFDERRMARDYVEIYEQLIQRARARSTSCFSSPE
jgi:glycosyltransferase involved in cell wall biosynthesis